MLSIAEWTDRALALSSPMKLTSSASFSPSIRISLRLKIHQAQAKNFCRVLDIRVTEVMEPRVPKSPVTPSPKYYCFLWGSQGSHHFTFYIVPIIQTLLFRYHCYCSVGDDLMSILRNAIQCKICGDVIESTSIHDFKGNTAQQEVPKTAECDIINLWINR